MLRVIIILSLVMFQLTNLIAQDKTQTLLLMTGKTIEAKVTSRDSIYLHYDLVKRNGKTKPKKLDMERVFSINGPDGEEEVIYYMDTAFGNFFSVDEMRYYIRGEQDAMNHYHANWVLLTGIPITAASGYLLASSIFVFALPFSYMVVSSLPKVKINSKHVSSQSLITEPAYVLGYERTARTKRIFKGLVAGVSGAAIGFVVGQSIIR